MRTAMNVMSMKRLKLPVGIPDLVSIRDRGYYYVDKTPHIQKLIDQGKFYFLSRPRRFGKSLLLDTLMELFEGNEPLFQGLHIHDHWDWNESHPVVRVSFSRQFANPDQINRYLLTQFEDIEERAGLSSSGMPDSGPERLHRVISRLNYETGKQIVVLVDEYDKPILDVLHDPEMARANRDYLRGFYGVIKDCASRVRFVLITGISMFSKTNLFSVLNNLEDISLDSAYATICGYTEKDLDTVFAPELSGLDREEIRKWYNGYHWLGEEKVYNPHDLLLLFRSRKFEPHWLETGTPDFLYQTMKNRGFAPLNLENLSVDRQKLKTFDVEEVSMEALMFQTGYLTIRETKSLAGLTVFTLDYPNEEVRRGLSLGWLKNLTGREREIAEAGAPIPQLLEDNDWEGLERCVRSIFAGLPHLWHRNTELALNEAGFATLIHACFQVLGLDTRVEEATARGRSDLVVLQGEQVFVIEFKKIDGEDGSAAGKAAEKAIMQIREKDYAGKYRSGGRPTHLIGMVFSEAARNLIRMVVEPDDT